MNYSLKHYEKFTDDELISGKFGYLTFDIETYSNYFLISFL